MDKVLLYEELRLIERNELHLNSTWKGAHLLLFFMAFVFGSFCTFNFHMLMYLFDKKCVLFPKLITLSSLPHDIIYEFIPVEKEVIKMLPVDFVSTQWMEKSVCYLPTYVPLMSCIFGIIWTTIFLVCYTGSRALAGSNRPWRVLPPIFVFSVAMSGICIYSSTITYRGLDELCIKLGKITGSATCSYTVNVATLAYERSIRGVYQAIQLTNFSAWLHTSCWILSAVLVLVRVLLAVDFQLVRVKAELQGDIDMMLEQYEEHMRTVSPITWPTDDEDRKSQSPLHQSHPEHQSQSTLYDFGNNFDEPSKDDYRRTQNTEQRTNVADETTHETDEHFSDNDKRTLNPGKRADNTEKGKKSVNPTKDIRYLKYVKDAIQYIEENAEFMPSSSQGKNKDLKDDNLSKDSEKQVEGILHDAVDNVIHTSALSRYSIAFTTDSDDSEILDRSFKMTPHTEPQTISQSNSDPEFYYYATPTDFIDNDWVISGPEISSSKSKEQAEASTSKGKNKSNLKPKIESQKPDKVAKVQILALSSNESIPPSDQEETTFLKEKTD